MKILILDESPQIAESLADLVADINNEIKIYKSSFEEAISVLEKIKPDTVVLDINIFGNNAGKLLEKIKTINSKTVVIGTYTLPDEKILKKCKELGADYLFDIYTEFEKIPEVIKSLLNTE